MVFWRGGKKNVLALQKNWETRLLTAQRHYVETLRREIAHYLMSKSSGTFENAFLRMKRWENELEYADKTRQQIEYLAILKKFPQLKEFDLLGGWHFLGPESSAASLDEMVERYEDLSRYLITDRLTQTEPIPEQIYNKREVEAFVRELRIVQDERLKSQIEEGMKRYYLWHRFRDENKIDDGAVSYSDADFNVFRLENSSPAVQHAVVCKSIKENGVYSFYVNYELGKTSQWFYRSNETFSSNSVLMLR